MQTASALRGVKMSGIKEVLQPWLRQLLSVIKSRRTSSIQQHQEEHLLQEESSKKCGINHRSTMEKHQPGRTLRTSQQSSINRRRRNITHRAAARTNSNKHHSRIIEQQPRQEETNIQVWSLKERLALLKITF